MGVSYPWRERHSQLRNRTHRRQANELALALLSGFVHRLDSNLYVDVLVDAVEDPDVGSRTEVLDRVVQALASEGGGS